MTSAMLIDKTKRLRDKKWTDSANGRPCDMCGWDDGTIVFAHMRPGSHAGTSRKPDDHRGAFLCSGCHKLESSNTGGKEAFWLNYLAKLMQQRYEAWKNGL